VSAFQEFEKGGTLRLDASHTRIRAAAVSIPAAVLGVATTLSAVPAAAAEPVPADDIRPADAATNRLLPALAGSPRIAPASTAPASCVVQPGDTVSSIAARYGLAAADVLAWNDLGWRSVIYPGQTLALTGGSAPTTPAPAASADYTVVAGDTLFAIAQRNGLSVDALLTANGLGHDSIIYPGQTLSIAAPAPDPAPSPATTSTPSTVLNAPQAENAGMIIRIGRELGVSDRGIAIALATAMVESGMRNLEWGDRDSLGLFQQRPSTGWGTPAQLRDPAHATKLFFGGATNPNTGKTRGLLDVKGWQSMTLTKAAQAVQYSAFPDAYAKWEAPATTWLATLG